MKLTTEELKEGEVYFADFGYNAAVIFRFETHVRTHIYYHSALKKDNAAAERFRVKDYCVLSDSIPLRPATEAEKTKLVKYEAENGAEYKEMGGKYQEFFNFLEGHFGITPTETGMSDIIQEALKLQPKPTETPLTAERLPEDFVENEDYAGCYEKEITKKLILGFNNYISNPFIYISQAFNNSDAIYHDWEEATEEKLNEIHKILTGEYIEFEQLELEKEIDPLEELQDYVISLEKRIIQLESNL